MESDTLSAKFGVVMEKTQWEKVFGDTVDQLVSFDEISLTAVMFEEPKMMVNFELRVNELVIYALVR